MFNNLFTPKHKKSTAEYFLAVEIHEALIKTAVWQVEDNTPSITALGSYELWDSEESLINGIDASLTEAIKGLSCQPKRVILGLSDSWLSNNKIHPTKQKLIKRLISELALEPIGMVTITEAIVSHLKTEEGIPPTAVLLEIYASKVIVSLVNLGEIQAQEEVGRSDDLARDVEEGLTRFEAEKLPARFVLTNGSDLENEEQQIISYPWTEKLPFLHLPKVQVLPIDFSIRSIALSGGSEAAKSLGLEVGEIVPPPTVPTGAPLDDASSLGFTPVTEEEVKEEEITPSIEIVPPSTLLSRLPRLSFPRLSFPRLRLPEVSLSRSALLLLPVTVLFLVLSFVAAYYFYFGSVEIALSITPTRVAKTLDLAIGTVNNDQLPTIIAVKKTLSAKASQTIPTTGEAVVGEKAIGQVTIYTTNTINLKQGTKIYALSGNQAFTLDSAAIIASGSATNCSLISPCTVSVGVTATKIGAEYNLEKDSQFSVDTYPKQTMLARSNAVFTGGSSRTVKAVAKDDQEKLLEEASQKVKSSIEDQLKAADPSNRSLAVGSLRFTTKNYDHSLGEEAANLSLDLAGDLDVLVYSQNDLLGEVEKQILDGASHSQVLQKNQTQIGLADPVPVHKDTFTVKASVDAVLLPQVDENQISHQVRGKKASTLKTILAATPGYKSSRVSISPDIPLLSQFLPLNTNRFSYTISSL